MLEISSFDKKKIETMPIFFIVGRSRSGTTVSRFLFDAHPNVVIPFESPFIISFYSKYGKIRNWTKKKLMSFYDDLGNAGLFYLWTINKEKLRNDLLACEGKTSYSTICKTVCFNYSSFYDKNGIVLLGDQNPIYLFFIKKLLKIFPEAKFVHLVRDYRDNIISMRKINLETPTLSALAYRWKSSNEYVYNLSKKYPSQFLIIKYENLANNTSETLMEICKFLNLQYQPSMTNFYKKADDFKKEYSEEYINKYFRSLFKPVTTINVDNWKNKMTEREILTADTVVGSNAELFGYERKYKTPNLLIYISNLPGIFYGWLYAHFIRVAMYKPFGINPFMIWIKIFGNKNNWTDIRKKDN